VTHRLYTKYAKISDKKKGEESQIWHGGKKNVQKGGDGSIKTPQPSKSAVKGEDGGGKRFTAVGRKNVQVRNSGNHGAASKERKKATNNGRNSIS